MKNSNLNPEKVINGETKMYSGVPSKTVLTDEQKQTFKPFVVETVEDIIMLITNHLKQGDLERLTEIHDRLMVTDIEIAYDVLIVMIRIDDEIAKSDMYMQFVPSTEHSKMHSKGIYHRCLNSLPIYNFSDSYDNPVLGEESYPDFAKEIIEGHEGWAKAQAYRKYVDTKYATVMENIIKTL